MSMRIAALNGQCPCRSCQGTGGRRFMEELFTAPTPGKLHPPIFLQVRALLATMIRRG